MDVAVDHGMGGKYVVRLLEQAAHCRGYPLAIHTDQGSEFAGCPIQNAYIESFNSKFRDE